MEKDVFNSYQRVWIWQKRHTPEAIATSEHRRIFKVFFTHWKKGKCAYCGILLAESPNHHCLSLELDAEQVAEFVSKHFV